MSYAPTTAPTAAPSDSPTATEPTSSQSELSSALTKTLVLRPPASHSLACAFAAALSVLPPNDAAVAGLAAVAVLPALLPRLLDALPAVHLAQRLHLRGGSRPLVLRGRQASLRADASQHRPGGGLDGRRAPPQPCSQRISSGYLRSK